MKDIIYNGSIKRNVVFHSLQIDMIYNDGRTIVRYPPNYIYPLKKRRYQENAMIARRNLYHIVDKVGFLLH